MDAAAKAVEPVIGECNEERVVVAKLEGLTDERRHTGDKRRR